MSFDGFSVEAFQFLKDLSVNNEKGWFEARRGIYEALIKEPSVAWVNTMGDLLRMIDPGIQAIPKANKSLFKIYRDTRFSKNKLPLKDHVGILLWSGARKRMESPGFYLHFNPGNMFIGAGIRTFSKELTMAYHRAISAPHHASMLWEIMTSLSDSGYHVGGKTRKRSPRGLPDDLHHPELALYSGLFVTAPVEPLSIAMDSGLLPFAFDHYNAFLPLHEWLKQHLG